MADYSPSLHPQYATAEPNMSGLYDDLDMGGDAGMAMFDEEETVQGTLPAEQEDVHGLKEASKAHEEFYGNDNQASSRHVERGSVSRTIAPSRKVEELDEASGLQRSASTQKTVAPKERKPRSARSSTIPRPHAGLSSLDAPDKVNTFETAFGKALPTPKPQSSRSFHKREETTASKRKAHQVDGVHGKVSRAVTREASKPEVKDPVNPGGIEGLVDEDLDGYESVDSTDYEIVHRDSYKERDQLDVPTETFQGTWEGALRDSGKALNEAKKATKTYYKNLKDSGLPKAGWSMARAFLGTANRGALNVASLAVDISGADKSALPGVAQTWLQQKEEQDAARKRAKDAKEDRRFRELLNQELEKRMSRGGIMPPSPGFSENDMRDISVERLRAMNAERGLIERTVNNRFQTPAPIRQQLSQPLQSPITPRPIADKKEESPYPPSKPDEEDDEEEGMADFFDIGE